VYKNLIPMQNHGRGSKIEPSFIMGKIKHVVL
jgi:hypothetical protein